MQAHTVFCQNPSIETSLALKDNGYSYEDLFQKFTDAVQSNECLSFKVVCEEKDDIELIFDFLKNAIEKFGKTTNIDISQIPISQTEIRTDLNVLRNTGISEIKTLRDYDFKPNEIPIIILKGYSSETCYAAIVAGMPHFYIGESIISSKRENYFIHLLGNLLGLSPIWGFEECGGDNIFDTPNHNAPNYDCLDSHISSCNGDRELNSNFMDARWCELDFSWTQGQLLVLRERADEIFMKIRCEQLGKTGIEECKFSISSSAGNKSTLVPVLLDLSGYSEGNAIVVQESNGVVQSKSPVSLGSIINLDFRSSQTGTSTIYLLDSRNQVLCLSRFVTVD